MAAFLFKHTNNSLSHKFLFNVFLSLFSQGVPIPLCTWWEANISRCILRAPSELTLSLYGWCAIPGWAVILFCFFSAETTAIDPLATHLPSYLCNLTSKHPTNYAAMDELCTH